MTATTTTFAELCRLEPRLAALADDIRAFAHATRRKRNFCANGSWYGYGRFPRDFKRRMSALVGWERYATHPDPDAQKLLASATAYDAAYRHLYRLLPPCRVCACL